MTLRYLEGIGILVGMIFGAGAFAIPYSITQSGVYWGTLLFGIIIFLVIFLHFRFAEVTSATEGFHRFTGYVRIWLGKKAEYAAALTTFFGYYGTLLVYGLMGGIFLSNILPFFSQFWWSIIFWLAADALILLNSEKIGKIDFYLTIFLFGFIIFIGWLSAPHIRIENFSLNPSGSRFLPYGILLFALSGFAVIPEVHDIFRKASQNSYIKHFKNVILISILLCAFFYILFTAAIVGVSGDLTSKDAISGLGAFLGNKAIIIGSLIGLVAVLTSYISLGLNLKGIFHYDYGFSPFKSWISVGAIPIILFLLGATNFISAINIVGSIGLGLTGIFIIMMSRKIFRLKRPNGGKLIVESLVVAGLLAGVIYEIVHSLIA